jgi:serine/threonine-protein kinase HipA
MLTFRYLADYLASNAAIPLSGTLPLGVEPFDERDIAAFFSNILPDEGVRRRIADILRLSPEDTFGLLRAHHAGTVPLVSLRPMGTDPAFTGDSPHAPITPG